MDDGLENSQQTATVKAQRQSARRSEASERHLQPEGTRGPCAPRHPPCLRGSPQRQLLFSSLHQTSSYHCFPLSFNNFAEFNNLEVNNLTWNIASGSFLVL